MRLYRYLHEWYGVTAADASQLWHVVDEPVEDSQAEHVESLIGVGICLALIKSLVFLRHVGDRDVAVVASAARHYNIGGNITVRATTAAHCTMSHSIP